jgi:YesN/AraC family two-component response regulator
MGNLCYDVRDELLTEYYEQQQAKISWHELLNRPEFADMEWYVADEEEKNQKMICFSGVPENLKDNETTAGELQKILSEALNGIPVSICTEAEPMEKKDIWICARRLRNILQHKVVLAQGSVFVLERDEPFQENEALEIVKMRITDHLLPHLQKRDKEAVSGELNLIFGYLSENPVPQADIQRILLYILRLMEFSEERFVDLQQDVFRAMSMMSAPAGIKQELSRILMKCLGSSTAAEDSESLSLQMKGYLDKNYTSIRNLGDLASVFSYSYAYLSRIFTRENGISMTRYVLEKRMELAEHLIREHKNLSIQQVAEMTGYDDGRYFSGLFKNYTGMTPSEYKAAEN